MALNKDKLRTMQKIIHNKVDLDDHIHGSEDEEPLEACEETSVGSANSPDISLCCGTSGRAGRPMGGLSETKVPVTTTSDLGGKSFLSQIYFFFRHLFPYLSQKQD